MGRKLLLLFGLFVSLFIFGCENGGLGMDTGNGGKETGSGAEDRKDYRSYNQGKKEESAASTSGGPGGSFSAQSTNTSHSPSAGSAKLDSAAPSPSESMSKSSASKSQGKSKNIGFQGGADQDMMLFRENIENGHIPGLDSITYNGIFSDYHFQQPDGKCESMFCPLVANGEVDGENRMQISLGSNIKDEDFKRPPTNFVVVIDKSGSMGSDLSKYYYENTEKYIYESDLCEKEDDLYFKPAKKCVQESEKQNYVKEYKERSNKDKIELAMESMAKMVDKFREDDRIGIVLYDNGAKVAHDLVKVQNIDKGALKNHLKNVTDGGGTNMESGMEKGLSLFDEDKKDGYQNRLLFFTDAMPNMGDYSEEGLAGKVKDASEEDIYFSFFGVGVDFQQQFIQKIGKFEGNNYFFISDAWQFSQKIVDEFDYNFFPMIFDMEMSIDDEDKVEEVYGLDNDGNELMSMNTLFPTPPTVEGHRGSIMLLKLKEEIEDNINLTVNYEKYTGEEVETEKQVEMDYKGGAPKSMKKGVNLVKYADALKESVQESNIFILEDAKEKLKENEDIFEGDDEKVFEKELSTIDKLIELIKQGEEEKSDYDPDEENRKIER